MVDQTKISKAAKIVIFITICFFAGSTIELYSKKSNCYEITELNHPASEILLNKCSGVTFSLTRTNITDANGKETGEHTYEWVQIRKNYDGVSVWKK